MKKGKLIFVTYADGVYVKNFKWNGFFAKYFLGADQLVLLTKKDLKKSEIYWKYRDIFDAPRGKGFWAWKPWAIKQALDNAGPSDIVIYQDCGFGFRYKSFLRPWRLIALAKKNGFVAGVRSPQYGPNRFWSHRRCIEAIGALDARFLDSAMIEAVVSIWTKASNSQKFLDDWLEHCLVYDLIADPHGEDLAIQSPEFKEHRCDQSILTNLAIRDNAFVLEPSRFLLKYSKSISILELNERGKMIRPPAT